MAAETLGVGEGLSEQVEGGMEGWGVVAHRRQGHKKERESGGGGETRGK